MNTRTYYQVTFMYKKEMHGDSYPGRATLESATQYISKLIAAAAKRGFKFQNITVNINTVYVEAPKQGA